jgi:membrane protease YdiL (CAAX protease family)
VGLPSVAAYATIHHVVSPLVARKGIPFFTGYMIWWPGFMALYLAAALTAYHLEGNAWHWPAFVERFRLQKPTVRVWLWAIGFLIVQSTIASVGLTLAAARVQSLPLFRLPDAFPPELRPGGINTSIPSELMGMPLRGRWWIAVLYLLGWALNIAGEELWFRGYLFPRQELAHGRYTWLVHGLCWGLNHLWQLWTLPVILPASLLWGLVVQKAKNTWVTVFVHGLANLLPLIPIVGGIIA